MLATIPLALKTLTEYLHIRREPCELIIPVGLTILRPGTMIQFACAAAFLGEMLGRGFSAVDVLLIAALVIGASVGTLGQFGGAGLMALAAVLRPFDLSFELAFPLLLIVEPIAVMARFMVVVAVTCLITVLAAGTERPVKAGAGTEDLSGVTLEKAGT